MVLRTLPHECACCMGVLRHVQVAAMQRDSSTYCDEPEDAADYAAWRASSFSMPKLQPEVDKIMAGGQYIRDRGAALH